MFCEAVGKTDVGIKRTGNEDNYCVLSNGGNIAFFAVADGMGGHNAGEIASKMAMDSIQESYKSFCDMTFPPDSDELICEWLSDAVEKANRAIHDKGISDPDCSRMGTTFTGVLFCNDKLYVGHVGDSRMYEISETEIKQITHDHSFVGEQVRLGILTEEEAERHPNRNIITRALGIKDSVKVDTFTHEPESGQTFLLCSDGLSGPVKNDEMLSLYNESKGVLKTYSEHLIDAANRNGGPDNITVVVFRVTEKKPGLIDSLFSMFKK